MKNSKYGFGLFVAVIGCSTAFAADIPHTFSSGSPAVASEVNENFQALAEAIDSNADNLVSLAVDTGLSSIIRTSALDYYLLASNVSDVVVATCPEGTALVGGAVSCFTLDSDPDTTNFGVVSATIFAGNSVIGGCYADPMTYSDSKYGPGITVSSTCLARTVDVTPAASLTRSASNTEQELPSIEALQAIDLLTKRTAEYAAAVSAKK